MKDAEGKTVIGNNTHLTVGLMITLIGAAISFGIMWNKIETLAQEVGYLRPVVIQLTTEVAKLNAKIDRSLTISSLK